MTSPPARRALAVWLALLTVGIWGVNYPAMKVALREMHPLAYTGWRFVLAAGLLLAETSWRREPALPPRGQRALALLLALTGVGLYQVFFAWGVALTSGFAAALLNSTSPLFSALFAVSIGSERWTPLAAAGSLVAYGGVALFLASGHAAGGESLGGNVLCLLSAMTWAVYTVAASRLPGRLSPLQSQFATFVGGSLPLIAYCGPAMARQDYTIVSPLTWTILVLSAVLPLVLAFRIWTWAIVVLGVAPTTSYGFLVPVVAGICSALWTGETFGFGKVASAAVVLFGLALTKAERAER
ncbi:MAG: DMT family transporter [Acidithiobacillales bacterium]